MNELPSGGSSFLCGTLEREKGKTPKNTLSGDVPPA